VRHRRDLTELRLGSDAKKAFHNSDLMATIILQFTARRGTKNRNPNDLASGKERLLGLILDESASLGGIHRRQLDELEKTLEARQADIDTF